MWERFGDESRHPSVDQSLGRHRLKSPLRETLLQTTLHGEFFQWLLLCFPQSWADSGVKWQWKDFEGGMPVHAPTEGPSRDCRSTKRTPSSWRELRNVHAATWKEEEEVKETKRRRKRDRRKKGGHCGCLIAKLRWADRFYIPHDMFVIEAPVSNEICAWYPNLEERFRMSFFLFFVRCTAANWELILIYLKLS